VTRSPLARLRPPQAVGPVGAALALAAGAARADEIGGWLGTPLGRHVAWGGLLVLSGALLWTRVLYGARLRDEAAGRRAADAALARVNRVLQALSESSQAALRATDEPVLIERVCRTLVETGGYRFAWVGLADEGPAREVLPVARAGHDPGYPDAPGVTWDDGVRGRGPEGTAVRLARPALVQDVARDPDFEPWRAQALGAGGRSVLALPLLERGRVFGVVGILAGESAAFDPHAVDTLADLAHGLAQGIAALRLRAGQRLAEQHLRVGNLKQALLNRLLHLALEPLPLEAKLRRVLGEVLLVPWLPLNGTGAVCVLASGGEAPSMLVSQGAGPVLEDALRDLVGQGVRAAGLGLLGDGARIACATGGENGPRPVRFCWLPIRAGASLCGALAFGLSSGGDRLPDLGPEQELLASVAHSLAEIIERGRAEAALALYATVFERVGEGIVVTDAHNRIVAANRAFCAMAGYDAREVVGRTPRFLRSDRHDDAFYSAIWEAIGRDGRWQGEIWNRRKSGEVCPEWLSVSVIRDAQGALTHHVGVYTDITMLKQSTARLDYLAHHDALTGLPNRLLLTARVDHALARGTRSGSRTALLFMDLDGFKAVNDTLGHLAGDGLLQAVAQRLSRCVREQDTVARLGGDEFVVLLEGLSGPADAALVARKVLNALARPFVLQTGEALVTASVGIAMHPDDAGDLAGLLERADAAMYRAKQRGRGRYAFHGQEPTLEDPARAATGA
jgi:diguanylate cyclase (GGDEF)-like protein/PAS domain S-box-containing protein